MKETNLEKLFAERNYNDLRKIAIRYLSVTFLIQKHIESRLNEKWMITDQPYETWTDIVKIISPDQEADLAAYTGGLQSKLNEIKR